MDQKSPETELKPSPAPVVDVTPPPAVTAVPVNAAHSAAPAQHSDAHPPKAGSEAKQPEAAVRPPTVNMSVSKTPKPAGNNTGKAIAATVIIVISLAILAVYAYLQSPK